MLGVVLLGFAWLASGIKVPHQAPNVYTEEGEYFPKAAFTASLRSSHLGGRKAENVAILSYEGDMRAEGLGTFHPHVSALLLDDHVHTIQAVKNTHTLVVLAEHAHVWTKDAVVIGTGESVAALNSKGGAGLFRDVSAEEHTNGVLLAHRVVDIGVSTDGATHEILLAPTHPWDAFKKVDLKVDVQRVLRKKDKKRESGHLRSRAIDSTAGGGEAGTISECTPARCESCDSYSDSSCDKYESTDGSDTYAWCLSVSDAEVCAEYEKTVSLLNLNYDVGTGEAMDKRLEISGVSGFACENCYAFLGGGVGIEIHYDYDLIGNDLWELSAHIWGASDMNLDLNVTNPSIETAIDTGEITLIPAGTTSIPLFTIPPSITVNMNPELRTRVRADGAIQLEGQLHASARVDADFLFGLEETAPYLFTDATFDFEQPQISFEKFSLVSSDANDFSVDLFAEADLTATIGDSNLGVDVLNKMGVSDKLAFETSLTLPDMVDLAGGLIRGDDDGGARRLADTFVVADGETPSVTSIYPGQTLDISLADFVDVADDSAGVALQTRVLDARIHNDNCFGSGVSIALKTALITVPVASAAETFSVTIPRKNVFSRCFGQLSEDSYIITLETITGKKVFISQPFAIVSPGAGAVVDVQAAVGELDLVWDPSLVAAPSSRPVDQHLEFDMFTPKSVRILAVAFASQEEALVNFYDGSLMRPLVLEEFSGTFNNTGSLKLPLPSTFQTGTATSEEWVKVFMTAGTDTRVSVPVITFHVQHDGSFSHTGASASVPAVMSGMRHSSRLAAHQVRLIYAPQSVDQRRRLADGNETCLTPTTRSEGFGLYESTSVNTPLGGITIHSASSSDPDTIDLSPAREMNTTCTRNFLNSGNSEGGDGGDDVVGLGLSLDEMQDDPVALSAAGVALVAIVAIITVLRRRGKASPADIDDVFASVSGIDEGGKQQSKTRAARAARAPKAAKGKKEREKRENLELELGLGKTTWTPPKKSPPLPPGSVGHASARRGREGRTALSKIVSRQHEGSL